MTVTVRLVSPGINEDPLKLEAVWDAIETVRREYGAEIYLEVDNYGLFGCAFSCEPHVQVGYKVIGLDEYTPESLRAAVIDAIIENMLAGELEATWTGVPYKANEGPGSVYGAITS